MLSWITGAVEIFGFLAFWAYDALLELFYLIFRCRPMKDIKKENILLTGTGQGLGRLITERLAKDGNILHCVDINMELNNKLKEDFKNADCTIYVYQCDVGNLDAVRKLGEEIKKNVSDRHISYLFNIAGIVMGKTFGDLTEGQLKKTMDVNVMGLLYLQKLVYPEMVQNNGHIINISSLAGLLAGPMIVDYATSKFAVTGMSQGLNMEMSYLGIKNVKVTSVHPHVTKTGMFNNCVAKWKCSSCRRLLT